MSFLSSIQNRFARLKSSAGSLREKFKAIVDHHYFTKRDNGMTYMIRSVPDSKILSVTVQFNAGTQDSPEGNRGVAHLLEHMIGHEMPGIFSGDFMEGLYRRGGNVHGEVDLNCTTYEFKIPYSSENEQFLYDMIQSVVFEPEFVDEHVQSEKTVLLTEQADRDDKFRNDVSFVLNTVVRNNGKSLSKIEPDSPEALTHITADDLQQFHQKYYVGANSTLTVIGPVDVFQTADFLDQRLHSVPAGDKNKPDVSLHFYSGEKRIKADTVNVHWALGFPIEVKQDDASQIQKSSQIQKVFSAYINLLLFEEFRGAQRKIIYTPSSFFFDYGGLNTFTISGNTMPQNVSQIMPGLAEVIGKLAKEEIDEGIFYSARERLITDIQKAEEEGRLSTTGYRRPSSYRTICAELRQKLKEVEPEDLSDIARDMLSHEPALVTLGNADGIHSLAEFKGMLHQVMAEPKKTMAAVLEV
jgi:predicted Zn-dependent peptidase